MQKSSPSKRHQEALRRSGSEAAFSRTTPGGLGKGSLTRSAADLSDPSGEGGRGVQRSASRGSLLKQLPPLEKQAPRDANPRLKGGDQRRQTATQSSSSKPKRDSAGYGSDPLRRTLNKDGALPSSGADKAVKESDSRSRAVDLAAAEGALAHSGGEAAMTAVADGGRSNAHETDTAGTGFFKRAPGGMFGEVSAPEKPPGPPPLSEAEKDLMKAVCNEDIAEAEKLLREHGPVLLSGQGAGGVTTTAILYAAQAGNKELCDLLVTLGGDSVLENGRDIKGRGAPEFAEKGGHTELCAHLRALEAKCKTQSVEPKRAQVSAASEGVWKP